MKFFRKRLNETSLDTKRQGAPLFLSFVRKGRDQKNLGAPSFATHGSIVPQEIVNGRKGWALKAPLVIVCLTATLVVARAAMPEWIQNIEARALVETAIFRSVSLPTGSVTVRRPPAETVPALADLVKITL